MTDANKSNMSVAMSFIELSLRNVWHANMYGGFSALITSSHSSSDTHLYIFPKKVKK